MELVDSIILGRLLKFYDPLHVFDTDDRLRHFVTTRQLPSVAPAEFRPMPERDADYHVGRVRFFADALRARKKLDPVEMDNECSYGNIGAPIIVDGHHRAIAHMLVRSRRVDVSYSGRVDTLRYLRGEKRLPPLDLR